MVVLKWAVISLCAKHARKLIFTLAEHAQKYVTRWLSLHEN
jgi:hypothetical protein